jgi:hypothetical protein
MSRAIESRPVEIDKCAIVSIKKFPHSLALLGETAHAPEVGPTPDCLGEIGSRETALA